MPATLQQESEGATTPVAIARPRRNNHIRNLSNPASLVLSTLESTATLIFLELNRAPGVYEVPGLLGIGESSWMQHVRRSLLAKGILARVRYLSRDTMRVKTRYALTKKGKIVGALLEAISATLRSGGDAQEVGVCLSDTSDKPKFFY